MPIKTSDIEATTARLLDAGEMLFAEHGYDGASIRDITRTAQSNTAAVNYHFGSKAHLYEAVYERRFHILREYRIQRIEQALDEAGDGANLEMVIRTAADAFVEPLLDESSGRRTMQLIVREMLNPRLPRGMFIDQMIRPMQHLLVKSLRWACPGLSELEALRCGHSLISQLMHAIIVQRIISVEDEPVLPIGLEVMVDHIVRFSAAGVRGCCRSCT